MNWIYGVLSWRSYLLDLGASIFNLQCTNWSTVRQYDRHFSVMSAPKDITRIRQILPSNSLAFIWILLTLNKGIYYTMYIGSSGKFVPIYIYWIILYFSHNLNRYIQYRVRYKVITTMSLGWYEFVDSSLLRIRGPISFERMNWMLRFHISIHTHSPPSLSTILTSQLTVGAFRKYTRLPGSIFGKEIISSEIR
jgi:hypothetical protein